MENVAASQALHSQFASPVAARPQPLGDSSLQSPLAPSLTLDSQLCFALYTASLAMTKAYKAALERFDLTYPQYLAMLVLWENDELSVKDLAARLGLDSATLTPILKRLETVGYVRRVRGVLDERLVLIHLTDNGRALKLSAAFLPDHISEIVGRPVPDLQRLRDELHDLKASLAGRMRM
jgi:MarR family transcriptional regulator, organic hydroperoxide resistance regulator